MAGTLLESRLKPITRRDRVRFEIATKADDPRIRRLLRETPMGGRITVSLEREPNYFADAQIPEEERQTIIARSGSDIICMGNCAIRKRFVNGMPRRVGYLGGLRLAASHAGRFDILRRGYAFFREQQSLAQAEFYFTSIAADNMPARQFLERELPGMPGYEFIGEFVSLIFATSHGVTLDERPSTEPDYTELSDRLRNSASRFQMAPCWSPSQLTALQPLGLRRSDFCVDADLDGGTAFVGLWDQRSFRQTVVRSYASALDFTRGLLNLAAPLLKTPRLPAPGESLASACISHIAIPSDEPGRLVRLMHKASNRARRRGIEMLVTGFAANDPRLSAVRKAFSCREYHTRLYLVNWQEFGGRASELDERILAPEIALL